MIGLGVSSISDSWTAFAQNTKSLEEYKTMTNNGQLPIYRGHILDEEDLFLRRLILDLMCNLKANWTENDFEEIILSALNSLEMMEHDNLIKRYERKVIVTEKGRPFIRNICMAFDAYLNRSKLDNQLFSKTV